MPVFDSAEMIQHEYLPLFEKHGAKLELSKSSLSPDEGFEQYPWYFRSLDAGLRERIRENWFDATENEIGYRQVLMEVLEDGFPAAAESVYNVKTRADEFKHQIFDYINE